jgi:hypothetical protein
VDWSHYEGRQVRYELADPHLGRALAELLEVVLAVAPTPQCAPDCTPVENGIVEVAGGHG